MNKPNLFLVLLMLPTTLCFAQQPSTEWGIAVGGTLSTYSGVSPADPSPNYSLGVYAAFPISEKFSIDPKIFFKYSGGATLSLYYPGPGPAPAQLINSEVKRTANYISIMAPLSYHFSNTLGVNFGPQFMILTSSTDRGRTDGNGDFLTTDSKDAMHQYDAGITTGVTYQNRITIGLMHYYGIMYAIKQNDSPAKNSILHLWIGIPIIRKSKS